MEEQLLLPESGMRKMPRIPATKICLIRMSSLGDIVHALAMVNGLRKGYPEAHLTWILDAVPYEMVKHQPNVDRFIVFRRKDGLSFRRKLARELKTEHFDLVLMPQVSFRASLISVFVRADIKLGFDIRRSRELHWLFTNRKLLPRSPQHVQDQFFEFLDYLEIKDYPKKWGFVFTDEELKWRQTFFQQTDRPVISFVISSSNSQKNWNASGYAQVIDHVNEVLQMQSMIIGGPSQREQSMAKEILRYCKSDPIVALEKPIRRTLLQLSGSVLVVSPDTGPLHAAVAMNIPTVGLYGFSNPRRCGPYRRFHDLLINKYIDPGEENSRIRRKTRQGRMERITPYEAIEKIELGLRRYTDWLQPA